MSNINPNDELAFEKMMEEKLKNNFASGGGIKENPNSERLKEMNKKLPSWNLEPPFNFLK